MPGLTEQERRRHEALGQALRAARLRAGLTLVEVQELSAGEYRLAAASAYERGERGLSVWRAAGLARLYGTIIDALVEEATTREGPGSTSITPTAIATR